MSFEYYLNGILPYMIIKFIGHTIFALYLNKLYKGNIPNFFAVSVSRTILGLLLGFLLFLVFHSNEQYALIILFILFPLRIFEWTIIFRIFYSEGFSSEGPLLKGILLSFALDVPAIYSFFHAAGKFFC